MEPTVDFASFQVTTDAGSTAPADQTPAVRQALAACRAAGAGGEAVRLTFPRGTYHFWPDRAEEAFYFVSNNNPGLKRSALALRGERRLTIEGNGAQFILHGKMSAFILDGCADVTIRNLTIDYDRPFFSQGEIVAAGADFVELTIDRAAYPWRVEAGRIIFSGPEWDGADFTWVHLLVQFDPRTRALAAAAPYFIARQLSVRHVDAALDDWALRLTASDQGGDRVRLAAPFGPSLIPGNALVISHARREDYGFLITGSERIRLEGIELHHAGAMGVIAQLSRDLTLERFNVRPPEGSERLVSSNADATHFVNCEGRITLRECIFENMLDDGGNIHGIYTTVAARLAPDRLELQLMHHEQQGINLYRPGDEVEFIDRQTLRPVHTARVREARRINARRLEVTFSQSLGGSIAPGLAVDNITRMPEVEIRGCRTGHNRPRGFLLGSRRPMRVEDNTFYNSSAGLWIAGDANSWFESGPVRDLTIRRNRFLGCGYADGCPPIVIAPEMPAPALGAPYYHQKIRIEDNLFQTRRGQILTVRSVERLALAGNTHERLAPDPRLAPPAAAACQLDDCGPGQIEEL